MKRFLPVFFILLSLAFFSKAQSFRLVEVQKEVEGTIGEKIRAVIKVENLTSQPIAINIKVLDNQISTGESSAFFWGDQRLNTAQHRRSRAIIIPPHAIEESFVSELSAGLSANTSSITYSFYNVNNPKDSVVQEVTFFVKEKGQNDLFYQNDNIRVSNLYPNPVTENKALVEYEIFNPGEDAKLVIHNLLGSIVAEYQLDSYQHQLTIPMDDLNPGVYFYSLNVNQKNLVTKKFIIKR